MKIKIYEKVDRDSWDKFVESAVNFSPLFLRHFIEYHNSKFQDYSLIFTNDQDEITALVPASIEGKEITSHGGLTFGGIILSSSKYKIYNEVIDILLSFIVDNDLKLTINPIPSFYSGELLSGIPFKLIQCGFTQNKIEISSVFYSDGRCQIPKTKMRNARAAGRKGYVPESSESCRDIIDLVNVNLKSKYGKSAVHTAEELMYLRNGLRDYIDFWVLKYNESVVGGAIIFLNQKIAHIQYLIVNETARRDRAQDLLITFMIEEYSKRKMHVEFGVSTEQRGAYLNQSLLQSKEEFGFVSCLYSGFVYERHS